MDVAGIIVAKLSLDVGVLFPGRNTIPALCALPSRMSFSQYSGGLMSPVFLFWVCVVKIALMLFFLIKRNIYIFRNTRETKKKIKISYSFTTNRGH